MEIKNAKNSSKYPVFILIMLAIVSIVFILYYSDSINESVFLSTAADYGYAENNESVVLPVVADYEYAEIIERKNLKVGIVSGPYGDMFVEAIMPSLEKMGYTAELVYYDNFISPNFALANNETDLNIFQHYRYLNTFKFEYDFALSAITEIPTVSMGIFSSRYRSIDELENGISVAIPDDRSNLSRALMVLEAAQIIRLNPISAKLNATPADIISNPYDIQIALLKAHDLVKSLESYDLSVINGNFAISGGLKPSEAFYNEVLAENYINVVAVRTEDLNKKFVRDIVGIIHSDAFRDIIVNPAGNYAAFQRPRSFYDSPFE